MQMRIVPLMVALIVSFAAPVRAQFLLTTPDVRPDGTFRLAQISNLFGCTGTNVAPALRWSGIPRGTRQLALTMIDPDTPVGVIEHWSVVGISPQSRDMRTAFRHGARMGLSDFGAAAYNGPCPGIGEPSHGYVFTLWAFDATLPLTERTSYQMLRFYARFHVLGAATLVLRYQRTR